MLHHLRQLRRPRLITTDVACPACRLDNWQHRFHPALPRLHAMPGRALYDMSTRPFCIIHGAANVTIETAHALVEGLHAAETSIAAALDLHRNDIDRYSLIKQGSVEFGWIGDTLNVGSQRLADEHGMPPWMSCTLAAMNLRATFQDDPEISKSHVSPEALRERPWQLGPCRYARHMFLAQTAFLQHSPRHELVALHLLEVDPDVTDRDLRTPWEKVGTRCAWYRETFGLGDCTAFVLAVREHRDDLKKQEETSAAEGEFLDRTEFVLEDPRFAA